jgi:hypothetical protein
MILTLIYFVVLATNCIQEFSFFGATNRRIWIVEHVGGECHYSKLIQIGFSDSLITSIESKVLEYDRTDYFIDSFAESPQISSVELTKVGDNLTPVPQMSFTLKPPGVDSSLLAKNFKDGVRIYPSSIVSPIIAGVHAQRIYQYEAGLYVNYQIDRAYFVPDKNILIVFTKNPLLTTGGDTMNGFMIFLLHE